MWMNPLGCITSLLPPEDTNQCVEASSSQVMIDVMIDVMMMWGLIDRDATREIKSPGKWFNESARAGNGICVFLTTN
jgi:hypothetical protein